MKRWIDRAVQIIVEYYAPDRIILFGSYAQGTQTPRSDIDLLIIKETHLPPAYRGREVTEALTRYPVKFDLLFYTSDEVQARLAEEHSFMDTVFKTGKILYQTT
jgi:predicted nucleotidyltransferase